MLLWWMLLPLLSVKAEMVVAYVVITFRMSHRWREMYIGHAHLYVCRLSLAACPRYDMDPDVTWEVVGVPSSCAALGRFAIGARVLLLWQHGPNTKCQRVLELTLCVVSWVEHTPIRTPFWWLFYRTWISQLSPWFFFHLFWTCAFCWDRTSHLLFNAIPSTKVIYPFLQYPSTII